QPTMPESPATSNPSPSSTSSASSKKGVWKTGAKGWNRVASAASNVARTASSVGGSVAGAAAGSRRKTTIADGTPGGVDPELARYQTFELSGASETSHGSNEKSSSSGNNHNNNNNVLKKTFKSIKKGAKKVDPRRVASAVKTSIQGENSNSSIANQLGTEEAEDAVLASVEKRSKNTVASEDGFRPAVEGETPPLRVNTLGSAFSRAFASSASGKESGASNSNGKLKMMAQQVMAAQRLERAVQMHKRASATNLGDNAKGHNHRRVRTLLDAIGNEDKAEEPEDAFGLDGDDFRDFHKVFDADPNEIKQPEMEETNRSSGTYSGSDEDEEPHEALEVNPRQ
ncbi:MAG: hypothetical protein SGILL_008349, partial [Bacillariaceae sp.]